jgi:hypothetical protein
VDITGISALDVAIGLSFIFLALSLVASAAQEILANVLALRSRKLEEGLRNMLVDSTPAPPGSPALAAAPEEPREDLLFRLYSHPVIRSLYRKSRLWMGRTTLVSEEGGAPAEVTGVRLPSYIPPRAFALALLDTIAPDVAGTDHETGRPRPSHDVIRETRAAILRLNIESGVKHRLLALLDAARGDVDAFRRNVEAWFDDTMARVSGWYKRQAQVFIVLFAVAVTVAMNANTLTIGERLWRDPALRATLVEKAAAEDGTTPGATPRERLANAVEDVESAGRLGVPIGWAQGDETDPRHVSLGGWGWAHLIGGWALTILAVSLGAPFWFDALGRLARLRGTGQPERPLPPGARAERFSP